MHWNYTWLQLYSWSLDAFSSNSYNAWHLLIRCRWQSFRYFQLKLSKNILCTLSAYQSMHHIKQLVEKLSDGAFPTENIPLCNTYILYNLIDSWNKCKNDYKMAGNHWCLVKLDPPPPICHIARVQPSLKWYTISDQQFRQSKKFLSILKVESLVQQIYSI